MKKLMSVLIMVTCSNVFAQTSENQISSTSFKDKMGVEVELSNQITRDKKNDVDGTEHTLVPELTYSLEGGRELILNTEVFMSNPEGETSEANLTNIEVGMEQKLKSPIVNSKMKVGIFANYLTQSEVREKKGYDGNLALELELKKSISDKVGLKLKPAFVNYLRTRGSDKTLANAIKMEVTPSTKVASNMSLELPFKYSKKHFLGDVENSSKLNIIPTAIFSLNKNFDVEIFNEMTLSKSGDDQFFADEILSKSLYGANLIYTL